MFSGEELKNNDSMALHHDLLVEMGRVELAMDSLNLRSEADPSYRQRLESRLAKLQDAMDRLQA